jgi:hypothetical protein
MHKCLIDNEQENHIKFIPFYDPIKLWNKSQYRQKPHRSNKTETKTFETK